MKKKFNILFLFVIVIALFSACKAEIDNVIPINVAFYDGDSPIEVGHKNPNTTYEFPATPTKEGFAFAGWELNGNLIPLEQKTYNLPESSTGYVFKATWTALSMTASFYNGEEIVDSFEIAAGNTYSLPKAPTKEGYTFTGWKIGEQTLAVNATEFTVSDYVADGYNFIATWDQLSMQVTFINGDEVVHEETIYAGNTYSFPAAPAIEGKTFTGWKLGNAIIPVDKTEYSLEYSETGYQYVATWDILSMKVTFKSDDEILFEETIFAGETYDFPAAPEKYGYTFAGWKLGDTTIPVDEKEYSLEYSASGYEYVATWIMEVMPVTFIDGHSVFYSRNIYAGLTYLFPNPPSKVGYAFSGWMFGDAVIPVEETEYSHEFSEYGYVYFATWTQKTMPVTFVNDGVTLFEDDIYAGETYAFPAAPEKYGYTFAGWKLGDTTIPVDETEYSLEYADDGYEYVATWSQIGMQVVFKNGEDEFFTDTVYAGKINSFPAAPEKYGYTFTGWKLGDTTHPADATEYIVDEYTEAGYEYVATWQGLPMTVSFKNDEDVVFEGTIITGETYSFPAAPEKFGFTFAGWKLGDITTPVDATEYTADYSETGHVYVATWTPKTMTVSFYKGKTVAITLDNIVAGETYTFPAAPENYGYDFTGWKFGDTVLDVDATEFCFDQYSETGYKYEATYTPKAMTVAFYDGETLVDTMTIYTNQEFELLEFDMESYSFHYGWRLEGSEEILKRLAGDKKQTHTYSENGYKYFVLYDDLFTISNEGAIAINSNIKSIASNNITQLEIPSVYKGITVKSLEEKALDNLFKLTSITLPETLTSIGAYAFNSCRALTSLDIPESVNSINMTAFNACSNLTNVDFPEEFNWVGEEVSFNKSEFLTEFAIPEGITTIKNYAFYDCNNLESVTIPNSVVSIGEYAFELSGVKNITIPNSVESIGERAFTSCSSLTSVTIVAGTKDVQISKEAFFGCTALETVSLPSNLTTIGAKAFHSCKSLTSISIPNSVESIGQHAFSTCTSLTSLSIEESGSTAITIGTGTFYGCTALETVHIPSNVTSIDATAFQNCDNIKTVYINLPDGSFDITGRFPETAAIYWTGVNTL